MLSLLVFGGVPLTVLADIPLKKSAGQNICLFLLGAVLYALVAIPVTLAFRITDFGLLFIIWEAVTVAIGLGIATLVFREALTIQRSIAFFLTIVALILSYWH
jgi:multidrug transporter EmrE-like cation transporter